MNNNTFYTLEDQKNMLRDGNSKAVVATYGDEYTAYRQKIGMQKRLARVEQDVSEIKEMLSLIISKM